MTHFLPSTSHFQESPCPYGVGGWGSLLKLLSRPDSLASLWFPPPFFQCPLVVTSTCHLPKDSCSTVSLFSCIFLTGLTGLILQVTVARMLRSNSSPWRMPGMLRIPNPQEEKLGGGGWGKRRETFENILPWFPKWVELSLHLCRQTEDPSLQILRPEMIVQRHWIHQVNTSAAMSLLRVAGSFGVSEFKV